MDDIFHLIRNDDINGVSEWLDSNQNDFNQK
jgi:hypothetical protein